MDLIQELANILEQDRPKSFNLLLPKGSKLRKLYKLKTEENLSDKRIARVLYDSEPGDKRFIMLRRNLIKKLSELVLVANHSDINRKNYIRVQFECEQLLTIARKLLFVNVYHNAERMTWKALKKAEKFHLVDVELACYQSLRKIYYLKGYVSEVGKYQQMVLKKQHEQLLIDKARGMIEMALSETKFIRSQSLELGRKFAQYADELEQDMKLVDSPFLRLHHLRIQVLRYHHLHETEEWYNAIRSIQELLVDFNYLETVHLTLELNISLVKYFNAVGLFEDADDSIAILLKNTSYTAFNRFEVMAELFDRQLNSGNFEAARDTLVDVHMSEQFSLLDRQDRAAWIIRSAICFIYQVIRDPDREQVPGFELDRLQVFYADCAAISPDKLGYNWVYIVLRTLLLALKGSIDYENEANKLRVYFQRYLKLAAHDRTILFFRYFLKILRAGMSPKEFDSLDNYFQEEFKTIGVVKEYCELVKYESLWQCIGQLCDHIDQNRREIVVPI